MSYIKVILLCLFFAFANTAFSTDLNYRIILRLNTGVGQPPQDGNCEMMHMDGEQFWVEYHGRSTELIDTVHFEFFKNEAIIHSQTADDLWPPPGETYIAPYYYFSTSAYITLSNNDIVGSDFVRVTFPGHTDLSEIYIRTSPNALEQDGVGDLYVGGETPGAINWHLDWCVKDFVPAS